MLGLILWWLLLVLLAQEEAGGEALGLLAEKGRPQGNPYCCYEAGALSGSILQQRPLGLGDLPGPPESMVGGLS